MLTGGFTPDKTRVRLSYAGKPVPWAGQVGWCTMPFSTPKMWCLKWSNVSTMINCVMA